MASSFIAESRVLSTWVNAADAISENHHWNNANQPAKAYYWPSESMGTRQWNTHLSNPLQRACERCMRGKRKCDKGQPRCGRCHRLESTCVYDYEQGNVSGTTSHRDSTPQDVIAQLPPVESELDQLRSLIMAADVDWCRAIDNFFHTVHNWFKILPRDKFESLELYGPDSETGHKQPRSDGWLSRGPRDFALLAICTYLVGLTDDDKGSDGTMFSPFYRATKRAFATLSCLSLPSMELMQCGALIALFEFGHGRGQFAYRTLSETLAMALTFGIKPGIYARDNDHPVINRAEEEEGRALWWGMFILDQYIHMDPLAKDWPLLVKSPSDDYLLPMESVIWNGHSHTLFERRMPVNGDVSIHLGTFQRAAQAATLLNKTYRWEQVMKRQPGFPEIAEIEDIDKAIRSMLNAMLEQSHNWDVFCDAFAMCLSSLFMLYRPYVIHLRSREKSQQEQALNHVETEQAVAAVRFGVRFVVDLAIQFNSHLSQNPNWLANLAPPANITCLQALEHVVVSGDVLPSEQEGFIEIYKALKIFSKRWALGEARLELLPQSKYLCQWATNGANASVHHGG
ncbi:hypothetical protein GQ53DRAFT_825484 [Thozetella sp. PMI_491]|nr:hypothetical protein GQ53DRAFT_825484 [Thozetella sp. PMI_491]